jgi:hypothetical protein
MTHTLVWHSAELMPSLTDTENKNQSLETTAGVTSSKTQLFIKLG